jgi:hypothetical protein
VASAIRRRIQREREAAVPRGHGASEFAQKAVAGAASNALIVLAKLRICP